MTSPSPIVSFCACCFNMEKDIGLWLCCNCGAGNSFVQIPEWAVKSIREQASWVGKRYYPHKEDLELSAEIKELRSLMPDPLPGRMAEKTKDGRWRVSQRGKDGITVSISVDADSIEVALAKTKVFLPYVSGKKE